MAGLTGEIEQKVLARRHACGGCSGSRTSEILTLHAVFDAVDVEAMAAVFGHQAVDQRDDGTEVDEPSGQVRTDESEPASDQDLRAGEAAEVGLCRAVFIHGQLAVPAASLSEPPA